MTRDVAIVPHTHWDREWYSPYQTFRLKLVELLDDLLPLLERDPSYAHFQLDGQMAVVDDYLEVRPEAADTLRRLATAGRLSMGPWYTLPDEFLVSGETLVRDLQMGLARAAEFGGAMQVGYLPDMFGHVAQMPQIFRQLGFDHAVVWRGVPRAVNRDGFWWESPDGSRVRAEYLPVGYGNGAHLPDDAKDLVDRVTRYEAEYDRVLTGPILWMNGTDHLVPQAWLGRVVAEANDQTDDYRFAVTSLAGYLAATSGDDLPTWQGELRSGARANLLMGVASNRVDVKQLAARAELGLERLAEPLNALFRPADEWPGSLLDLAWREVVRNAAHDSVCACSVDEVCDAVNHRYGEAIRIAEGLTDQALTRIARRPADAGPVIVNPGQRTRSGVVALRLPGEGTPEGTQLVSQRPTEQSTPVSRAQAQQMVQLALDHADGFYDAEVGTTDEGTVEVTLFRDQSRSDRTASGRILDELAAVGDPGPDTPVMVRLVRPAARDVLAHITELPGYSWRRWEPAPLTVAPVAVDGDTIDNGLVRIEVDATTGTFSIGGRPGFGRLVDGGDTGDTYNYNPPFDDTIVDEPVEVAVTVVEQGTLRVRARIEAHYRWPERAAGQSRVGERDVTVTTDLEVTAGEPFVRVTTGFDNPCRDHRLRAHFPLGGAATSSRAECAFTVVERGLEAEGGPTEHGLPTYPSRRFVQADDVTIAHEGLLEYELIDIDDDGAHTLAVTLLRCTGLLSQGPMAYRMLPAGPVTAMEGPQMIGPVRVRYAVQVGDVDPFELVESAFVGLQVVDAPGGGDGPDAEQALEIGGCEVSAVLREGGALTIRAFNPTSTDTVLRVPGRQGWLVDLRGHPLEPFESEAPVGPHQIVTLRLD